MIITVPLSKLQGYGGYFYNGIMIPFGLNEVEVWDVIDDRIQELRRIGKDKALKEAIALRGFDFLSYVASDPYKQISDEEDDEDYYFPSDEEVEE